MGSSHLKEWAHALSWLFLQNVLPSLRLQAARPLPSLGLGEEAGSAPITLTPCSCHALITHRSCSHCLDPLHNFSVWFQAHFPHAVSLTHSPILWMCKSHARIEKSHIHYGQYTLPRVGHKRPLAGLITHRGFQSHYSISGHHPLVALHHSRVGWFFLFMELFFHVRCFVQRNHQSFFQKSQPFFVFCSFVRNSNEPALCLHRFLFYLCHHK